MAYRIGVIESNIREKRHYAESCMNLPKYAKVPKAELPKWQRKYYLLLEIKDQIEICEQLTTPLTEAMIEELCTMQNITQVRNYCNHVKFA